MNDCPNCHNNIPLRDKFLKIYLNPYECRTCKCILRLNRIVSFHFLVMLFFTSIIYRNFGFGQLFIFFQSFNVFCFLLNVWVSNPVKINK